MEGKNELDAVINNVYGREMMPLYVFSLGPFVTKIPHMPALADKVSDTTGAGDTFIGAFLAYITREYDLKTCLSLASAASAIQVGSVGCRTSLSSMEQAFSFLKEKDTIPSF